MMTRIEAWGTLFLKAIPANTLVGMAVVLGTSCRDGAGKIMALYFPVLLFVISGYEHCVANSESSSYVPKSSIKVNLVCHCFGQCSSLPLA